MAAAPPRFHPRFTPTSSSWINLVERWFAELTTRKLRRSAPQRHRVEQEPPAVRVDQDRG
jgi:transposase